MAAGEHYSLAEGNKPFINFTPETKEDSWIYKRIKREEHDCGKIEAEMRKMRFYFEEVMKAVN